MTDKAALSGLMTAPALPRPSADKAIQLARDFAFRDAERKRDPASAGLATPRLGVYLPSGSHGAWDTLLDPDALERLESRISSQFGNAHASQNALAP
jgi:hypothetical protein